MEFKGILTVNTAMDCIHSWRRDISNIGVIPQHVAVNPANYVQLRDDHYRRFGNGYNTTGELRLCGSLFMATYEVEENEILIGTLK